MECIRNLISFCDLPPRLSVTDFSTVSKYLESSAVKTDWMSCGPDDKGKGLSTIHVDGGLFGGLG